MERETIRFFHLEEPYGCLSNFSRHAIYLEGMYWPTVEHYYQASKFDPYEHLDHRDRIRAADTPSRAKRLGRTRKRRIRADWNDARVGVMRAGLEAKVMQHADVRAVLLDTAPARLVQRTDHDRFWGDGSDRDGRNMLGELWMEIRAELLSDGGFDELAEALVPPWKKFPDIPRGSIGWRMGPGESYLEDWHVFFGGLTPSGRIRYSEMYPPPDDWGGFYDM